MAPWSLSALVGELLALVFRVVHHALTPLGVCTVCAIRLAAPFTASDATVDQVTVHVRRDRDRGVPQEFTHHGDISPGGEHQGCGIVPQAVER